MQMVARRLGFVPSYIWLDTVSVYILTLFSLGMWRFAMAAQ